MGLIGVHELNEENGSESGERVVLEDIFRKLQQWVLAMTSGTERDDQQVSNEVNTLHSAMVLLMVNVLLHLTPDYPPDLSELSVAAVSLEEDFTQATVQKMQEDALRLSVKLKQFSCFIVGCCQEMVEDISIHKTTLMEEDPDYELKELETIKNSCNEWIETCQLLLSEITKNSDLAMTSQDQNGSSFAEVRIIQNRGIDSRDGTELDDNIPEEIVEVDHVAMPENGKAEKNMKDRTPDESTLKEEMRIIWHDGNIHRKSLNGDDIPFPLESVLAGSRSDTSKSVQAFDSLRSLEYLKQRLLQAELRAQKAEGRSEALDEQLKAALLKIQELEKTPKPVETEETPIHIEATEEQSSTLPHPKKKRPKSVKDKVQK
eukprot:XP_017949098.1 PREDICTED: axonemal dynein light chain domain-containing protein 1-like isoform X2 [Xenopus tropicalis]